MKLQELVQRLQKLQVDNVEYAYLRALVLFSTGKCYYVHYLPFPGIRGGVFYPNQIQTSEVEVAYWTVLWA